MPAPPTSLEGCGNTALRSAVLSNHPASLRTMIVLQLNQQIIPTGGEHTASDLPLPDSVFTILKLVYKYFHADTYFRYLVIALVSAIPVIAAASNTREFAKKIATCHEPVEKVFPAIDRKSTRLNSSHLRTSRMPSSA